MTNSMKPVYLIAGSPRRHRMPDPLFQAALRESGMATPSVGYVGTANDDDTRFLSFMMKEMQGAGAGRINHALITPKNADLKKAQNVLVSADIVFISGGDVEAGIYILREKNMLDFLTDLYRQGKPFFGISAGAIMLAARWVRWRDPEDDSSAELFPCLGFAPIICDTHDEAASWEELQAALRLAGEGVRGYGLATGSGIKVFSDGKVEALGGQVYQYIKRGSKVVRMEDVPVSD